MRRLYTLLLASLCFAVLSACGNANDGKPLLTGKKSSASTTSASTTASSNAAPNSKLLFCKTPLVTSGELGQMLAGSTVCPAEGNAQNVRGGQVFFKVSGNVPVNTRLCIVPFVGDNPTQETCFNINGSLYVQLSTDQYSSVVVLAESALNDYKSYIINPAAVAPPRAVYSL